MRQLRKKMKKSPENKLKDMERCDSNDRDFKIAILKKLSELQENTDRQLNQLRNGINKQNKYFAKETATFKKNQIQILEVMNSIREIKNELVSLGK